jgi:hypothetical protein
MGNITAKRVVGAFNAHQTAKEGNYHSTGISLFLFGNQIAQHREDGTYITNCGWVTQSTSRALNCIPGVKVKQKDRKHILNGEPWDGRWIKVSSNSESNPFGIVSAVAKLGEIFCDNQKDKNDWKKRMLQAGLPALDVPEDWDTLSEDEKERRLNGVIGILNEK